MAKQIIAPEAPAPASVSEVAYYSGLSPQQRASLAHEMAAEVLQHYSRASTLVMVLANSLRDRRSEDGDPTALNLAEVVEEWVNHGDHISQERRLMACLEAAKDASRG